jgi:hypothetical protein
VMAIRTAITHGCRRTLGWNTANAERTERQALMPVHSSVPMNGIEPTRSASLQA